MALSNERIGEIALAMLQIKMEEHGELSLKPGEIKRDIMNGSKKYGITPHEGAEMAKILLKSAYDKTMAEIDKMIKPETPNQSAS